MDLKKRCMTKTLVLKSLVSQSQFLVCEIVNVWLIVDDLFKEKEEITRKVGTEGPAAQEAMGSRISCSGNQKQNQEAKETAKGRKSHIAEKKPPQAGSFHPFHQSL